MRSQQKMVKGKAASNGGSARRARRRYEYERPQTPRRSILHTVPNIRKRHKPGALAAAAQGMGTDAGFIECRVLACTPGELLDRYHELVDKRLRGSLNYSDLFELERIEARLDTEDEGEVNRLATIEANWRRERAELVASIERLLVRFKAIA